jgi:DNA-directed RNA polymerase subunit RPC12/RpoP
LDEENQPVQCPQCGSLDLRSGISKPRTWSGALHLAIGFLFSVYPLSTERGMLCDKCGHFFRPQD